MSIYTSNENEKQAQVTGIDDDALLDDDVSDDDAGAALSEMLDSVHLSAPVSAVLQDETDETD